MGCQNSTNQLKRYQIQKRPELVIGYLEFSPRGLAVRYVLELAHQPYIEARYSSLSFNCYRQNKIEIGLDFPNLPYLIDGDFSITESQNIENYLIELKNQQSLYGEGKQKYRVDNIRFLCDHLFSIIYQESKQIEEGSNNLNSQVIPKIQQLKKALGNKTFFFNKLTIADIYAYIALKYFQINFSNAYNEFASSFDPFFRRFEQIPSIKKFNQSNKLFKQRVNFKL
ncbi:hypothetical protein ABPG74_013619 [Tetrahymena malaccensis]